jgi:hypothetical protein
LLACPSVSLENLAKSIRIRSWWFIPWRLVRRFFRLHFKDSSAPDDAIFDDKPSVHSAGWFGSGCCYSDSFKMEGCEGAMNSMRGFLMLLAAGFAAWKGWRIHSGPHAPLQMWTAFGLAALALGLAVWHLTRGVRD